MKLSVGSFKKMFVGLLVALVGGALLGFYISKSNIVAEAHHPSPAPSVAISAPCCVDDNFFPSGYMGDIERIQLDDGWKENCHTIPCIKVSYEPGGEGWAGVYWQYPAKNWGDEPGREIKRAKTLVFWAKGEKGGELVSFKVGGIKGRKYEDPLEKTVKTFPLDRDWHRYDVDLTGEDTSSVIGAFAWIVKKNGNPKRVIFYLDDICFE